MRMRTVLAAGLALSCPAFAGCGQTASPTVEAKAEPLSDQDKADFQAQLERANDEEKAQQVVTSKNKTRPKTVDEEERAQQRR